MSTVRACLADTIGFDWGVVTYADVVEFDLAVLEGDVARCHQLTAVYADDRAAVF